MVEAKTFGLINDDSDTKELNSRTLNLAYYLKLLTIEQHEMVSTIVNKMEFNELMGIINIMNPIEKQKKINELLTKFSSWFILFSKNTIFIFILRLFR